MLILLGFSAQLPAETSRNLLSVLDTWLAGLEMGGLVPFLVKYCSSLQSCTLVHHPLCFPLSKPLLSPHVQRRAADEGGTNTCCWVLALFLLWTELPPQTGTWQSSSALRPSLVWETTMCFSWQLREFIALILERRNPGCWRDGQNSFGLVLDSCFALMLNAIAWSKVKVWGDDDTWFSKLHLLLWNQWQCSSSLPC